MIKTIRGCAIGLILAFAVAIAPIAALAQSTPTGTLSGVVKDPTGAVMPDVTILVRSTGTQLTRQTITDQTGRWTMPALSVGIFEISYEAPGFKTLTQDGVPVEASVSRTIDAELEIGATSDVVNVTENVELLTPTTAATFRQISSQELLQVPTSNSKLHAFALSGSRVQLGATAGFNQQHGEHLALGEWHAYNQYELVFQRRRCHKSDLQRRLSFKQYGSRP